MKKKFWIAVLTAVLLNILPVMTPSAAAADGQSYGTFWQTCPECKTEQNLEIIGYVWKKDGFRVNEKQHWLHVLCPSCHKEGDLAGDDHIGGTETPTCTTGKTCEKCGGEYGILGHDWGEWTSNGDNKTHTRTCKRDGCGAFETENCGGDGNATCVTLGTCTACGGQYYGGHAFPARWKWDSDTEVGRDAESHWVWCLNCTEAKAYMNSHSFVQGNDPAFLKSPATCVSKAVYYAYCGTCLYKGTDTYEYQWGNVDPKNHPGVTEVRGKKDADCTHDGYTGDICCKDCDAVLTPGKAIPATGHVGGTEVRGKKDADCTHDGYTGDICCRDCGAVLTSGKAIPATGHVGGTEVRGKKDADCTHDGYTGDTYCKDCGAKLTSGKVIPATGHVGGTEVRGKKDADCTHDGYTGDTYCKDCGAKLASGKVIPATGHVGGTATCCWPATCEVCNQGYGGMDAGNHLTGCKPEWIATGTTHEQKYSYCGMIASQKAAHTFGDWTVTQEAAAGKEGKQERVCTVCAYTETKVIPAKTPEASPTPTPTPVATPEPTAEPAEQTSASGSAWWWIIILVVLAGTGTGIAVWRKKKDKE